MTQTRIRSSNLACKQKSRSTDGLAVHWHNISGYANNSDNLHLHARCVSLVQYSQGGAGIARYVCRPIPHPIECDEGSVGKWITCFVVQLDGGSTPSVGCLCGRGSWTECVASVGRDFTVSSRVELETTTVIEWRGCQQKATLVTSSLISCPLAMNSGKFVIIPGLGGGIHRDLARCGLVRRNVWLGDVAIL